MEEQQSICLSALGNASSFADLPALIQRNCIAWNYSELRGLVAEVVGMLTGLGMCREDTIAVVMPDGAAGLVSQLAVLDVCGCAPLDPSLTGPELRRDLVELGVRAVICPADYEPGSRLAKELGLLCIVVSGARSRFVWDLAPRGANEPGVKSSKSNLGAAILLHTSATTGRRKIVPLTRANLKASCENTRRSLRLCQEDRLLVMARLFHAQGILSALSQWSAGGCVIVPGDSAPTALMKLVSDLSVTWYTCGPTLHQAILAESRKPGWVRPRSLRFVRSGGNTLSQDLKNALKDELGVPILDMYGLSETGAVAATPLDDPEAFGWRSVGPEICVMSKDGQPVESGLEGEIAVRGPSVMGGYWNDEAANREAFWIRGSDRWFRTGDLGRIDESGSLTMSGRAKEIINRGAQKIQPNEVDFALRQHPAIKEVAAFGVPHPTLGEDVACAVVLHEAASATEAELQAFARKSLARYKVPRKVHFVSEIPHGATGKPQRLLLRERLLSAIPLGLCGARPAEERLNRVESAIAEVWARRLDCVAVRLHDDFFQLGGDSLEAASMLAEVKALLQVEHGRDLDEVFFEAPTVYALSALLSNVAESTQTTADPLRQRSSEMCRYELPGSGTEIHAFMIPADNDHGLYYRSLARYMGDQRHVSIVRPENGSFGSGPDVIELSAAETVKTIQERLPHGPYLIGGFCLGGVVAFETSRLLVQQGERVLLVLFDSPSPGEPQLIPGCAVWIRHATRLVQSVLREEKRWRNVAGFARMLLRRVLWITLVKTKAYWRRLAAGRTMDRLRRESQMGYFPLYMAAPSRMPILHFVADQKVGLLREASLRAWSRKTSAGYLQISVAATHHSMFADSNLVHINQTIETWAKSQMLTPQKIAQQSSSKDERPMASRTGAASRELKQPVYKDLNTHDALQSQRTVRPTN